VRRGLPTAALGLALCAAQPAEARRTVDYGVDDATLAAWAQEQGVAAPAPVQPAAHTITLELAPGLDHEVVRGGIFCSAWTVDNPVTALLKRSVAASGPPATAARPPLTLRVDRAATLSRCVQIAELRGRCITRVTFAGTVMQDGRTRPVHAEIERATNSIGACAGLTRGIALVSREAALELIAKADAEAAAAP
jgi:hypothetical protein